MNKYALMMAFLVSWPGWHLLATTKSLETKIFDAQPGDTLIVQNDHGRVRVQAWNHPRVEAQIQRIAAQDHRLDHISVASHKTGNQIFISSSFGDRPTATNYIDIQAPQFLNVVIWGTDPAVEVYGIHGYVRVHVLTGLITAENLTSSVSLISEQGDIVIRNTVQPQGDIRLESTTGNIRCQLNADFNMRGWARAGGTLLWNQEIELQKGSLERQIGSGGPLIYAQSLMADVQFNFLGQQPTLSQLPTATPHPANTPISLTGAGSGETVQLKPESQSRSNFRANSGSSPQLLTPPAQPIENRPQPVAYDSGQMLTGSKYTLKVNVDWVYLNASVRERHSNRSIAHLNKKDFLVYEDRLSQQVEYFEPMETPFNLILLLDVSGSTSSYFNLIKEASVDFTRQIKPRDRIAIASFNSRTRLLQDFTSDRREVSSAIKRMRSGGGTAFYDALEISIDDYMRNVDGRKAIVVFTDGVDNQLTGDYSNGSATSFDRLFRQVQETDSIIYTIFLDTENRLPRRSRGRRTGGITNILIDILGGGTLPNFPAGGQRSAHRQAQGQLQTIADQTGGRMYSPRRIEDLSRVYSEIAGDLRIQYRLGYHSTNPAHDGSWRRLQVKIKNRSDAVVRTRTGYYADK